MSVNNTKKLDSRDLEQLLSATQVSRAGTEFVPSDDRWTLDYEERVTPSLSRIEALFERDVKPYFRLAMARYAAINAPDTVRTMMDSLSMVLNDHASLTNILDPIQFISLKAKLGKDREWSISKLRSFFRFWYCSGLWGVSDGFISATDKLVFSGGPKGRPVREKCPVSGPYTPIEMQGIITGINNAFANRELEITPYLATLLLAQMGVRRKQAVQLVFGDFKNQHGKLSVAMPRAKQRGADHRDAFTNFEISEDLYAAVMLQKQYVIDHISVCQPDIESLSDFLPVFPKFDAFRNQTIRSERDITPGHHSTRISFAELLHVTERIINVHSERTGMPLHLTASRFRRSLGTDLAREGHGVSVIATSLDHTDHQHAGVYIESSAEFATRLDMRIGKALAPMAQAFAGVIVKSEKSAIRGSDPTSRVRSQNGVANIGSCGEFGFCGAHAPVACYTCSRFQPWLDAPHEDVLFELYEERKETLAMTGDETIAGILDRQILAVEDVIARCAEININTGSEAERG
jgi:hypothetical protein